LELVAVAITMQAIAVPMAIVTSITSVMGLRFGISFSGPLATGAPECGGETGSTD